VTEKVIIVTEPTSDVMTADEVATFLRVNIKTVYDAVKAGEIPAVHVMKTIRFSKTALNSWLDRGGLPPAKRKR
jgi:excisionase family DNA binding protein